MSKQSYSEWFKNTLRDPLWWIGIGSLVGVIIVNLVRAPYELASAFWCVFGLTFIGMAIRGKDVGHGRPMTTAERLVAVVAGIVIVVLFAVTIFTRP